MPIFKATLVFNDCRQGWSETWYVNQDSQGLANIAVDSAASWRSIMLGPPVQLEASRVTPVDSLQRCGLRFYSPFTGGPNEILYADTPWNGWLAEVMADGGYCRPWIIRGIPDLFINRNPNSCVFPINATFKGQFDSFKTAAIDAHFNIRVILKPEDGGEAPKDIGAIAVDLNGNATFAITGLVGGPGKKVKFTSFTGPDAKLLNGVHQIISNNGAIVAIRLGFASLLDPPANVGGKAWAQVIGYRPINNMRLLRPAKRSTGRAFFVPRGRRPRRS